MDIGVTLSLLAAAAILTSTLIAAVSRLQMQWIRVSLETANRPRRRIAVSLVAAIRRTTAPQILKRFAPYTLLVLLAALPLLLTACGKGGGGGGGGGGY